MVSLDRVRLGSLPWLWERGVAPWSLLSPSVPLERPRSVRDGEDPGGCGGGLGLSAGPSVERSRDWLRARGATSRFAAPGLSIKCLPSLRLTIRTTSSPERRGVPPTEYRPPLPSPPPPPLEEAVEESLSPDRRLASGNFVSLFLQLRGLKWRGSERSRGGLGSNDRPVPESSSEEPEGFRERPERVEEDEGAPGVEDGSRERRSGGL